MADLRWDLPKTEEVEVDEETAAEIDQGLDDMENGRWITAEEARKLIPIWISKFASQRPR
jgi:predicted transcriptional regulator